MLQQVYFKYNIHSTEHPIARFVNTVYQMFKLTAAAIYSISKMKAITTLLLMIDYDCQYITFSTMAFPITADR